MTKVVVRVLGGLGNQLFCYAAARRLALVNDAELLLDDVSGFVNDHAYRRTYQLDHFNIPCSKASPTDRLEPFSRVRRYLKRILNRRRAFANSGYIQQEGVDFDPRLLSKKPAGTLYLEGYWQSEQYFRDIESTIRQELSPIPPTDAENMAMAERIANCTAVAVHVRFFDTPQESGENNAPSDYYVQAIAKMEGLVADVHYFIFSDQPAVARERIPLPESRMTMISHNLGDENAYADLWLMTQCNHFIIANSTFSWWGAWLADRAEKQIIAPKYEKRVGKMWWGFDGLLPAEWHKI